MRHPDFSFHSYAGYLTVNKEYNSNLFFWYVPARVNPENAPVMLWLQGGPGTPSSFALFLENGPYFLTKKQKLVENKYSWCINHHMLYIDSPVGTGYSFTESDAGYARNQKDVGHNLLVALRQFFLLFPDLQKNDFYVAGESYGGKYVPGIGYAILQDGAREDFDQKKPKINLKGLGIANGLSDPIHQLNYGDFLYQLGLIDTNGLDLFKKYESQGVDCLKRRDLDCAFKTYDELIIGTEVSSTVFGNLTGFTNYYNYLIAKAEDYSFFDTYLQRYDIRRAIHVGNNSYASSDGAGLVASYLRLDFYDTVAPWVSELLSHYPIFVYNGALDVACAYSLAENYLKHLDFDAAHEYKTAKRCIWRVNEEIAGYMKHAGNLTEVMVRNAGKID